MHVSETSQEPEVVKELAFLVLHKQLLIVADHPCITRFWLFSDCVWALCRWKLLHVPSNIIRLASKQPLPRTLKRLTRVKAWMDSQSSDLDVRIAALCLRLCGRATNITGKKLRKRDDKAAESATTDDDVDNNVEDQAGDGSKPIILK